MDQFAGGQTGKPWTEDEIEQTIAAYFAMLEMQWRGERYAKVDVVRGLRGHMSARSHAAIEYKFSNISAILEELGRLRIGGYKPLPNYQRDLRSAVVAHIEGNARLSEALVTYGENALVARQPRRLATDDVVVPPPHAKAPRGRRSSVDLVGGPIPALRDFQLKRLGTAGEEWVLDLEQEQLRRKGRSDLAERIVWTARDVGDGAGYDIASYYPDGRERLIEVKTTNLAAPTPFYITRWEVDVSRQRADAYSLYRVHGFGRDPRLYILDGSVEDNAKLDPKVFLGIPL